MFFLRQHRKVGGRCSGPVVNISESMFVSQINWAPFKNIIERHQSFLITTHVRPDADALGSQRGLAALLESFGREVLMVNATAPPENLNFMNIVMQFMNSIVICITNLYIVFINRFALVKDFEFVK